MDNIIEVEFKKQKHTNTSLLFANSKVYGDARVYAYLLYDLVDSINSHFWNNYQTSELIEQHHAYEFDKHVAFVKSQIGQVLEMLYANDNNDDAYRMLKCGYDYDIRSLLEWLKSVGLEYRQANIIDIKNFIGMR